MTPKHDTHISALLDLFLSCNPSICSTVPSLHCKSLIMLLSQFPLTFTQTQKGMPLFIVQPMTIIVLIRIVFMNWEMMSSYLPTGYFSWCYWILQEGQVETGESFRSSLIHLNGFHLLLAAIAHRNYFFQSIKQNKSSAPFENFESLQSYDIKVCFLITLYAGALQLY